jgi:replicative DNA helicase
MENNKVLPPHDIAAEEALLGAVLLSDSAIDEVSLHPSDFYHEPHMIIFKAMVELRKYGTGIDQITLSDELNRIGKLEFCGGVAILSHLVATCPSPLDAIYYAEIIKRNSIARQLIKVGLEIQQVGYDNPSDSSKALSECDDKLVSVRKMGIPSVIISPKERASRLFDRYVELENSEMAVAYHTGIPDLNKMLGGGFYKGDYVIVGARTSMGKTTFLRFIADSIALQGNVLLCSAEMDNDSLSDREVAQAIGVPINTIRLGKYGDELGKKILDAVSVMSEKNVYIYDDLPMTTDKILQSSIAMQLRHGLAAIVIDYLGMLDDEYGRNSYERVGYMSRKIKQIARRLNVPVIVAHQLNRELEKRDDKRPHLFDLRDSGAIEQDADIVLFLYRDSYYVPTQANQDDITEIIVAKQRQGDANLVVKVRYDKAHQQYQSLYRGGEESLL